VGRPPVRRHGDLAFDPTARATFPAAFAPGSAVVTTGLSEHPAPGGRRIACPRGTAAAAVHAGAAALLLVRRGRPAAGGPLGNDLYGWLAAVATGPDRARCRCGRM